MSKIIYNGANGFVGRNLTKTLEKQGHKALGLMRRPELLSQNEYLNSVKLALLQQEEAALIDAMKGAKAFVHLAGKAHQTGRMSNDFQNYAQTNVELTMKMAALASKAAISKFIFISSIGVHGAHTIGQSPFRVEDKPQPHNAYALSKLRAEEELRSYCRANNIALTIIRPPLIYGPSAPGNIEKLKKLAETGLPVPFASLNNKRAILEVSDLCDAIIEAAFDKDWSDKIMLPVSHHLSTRDIYEKILSDHQLKSALFACPPRFLKWGGMLVGKSHMAEQITGDLVIESNWRPKEMASMSATPSKESSGLGANETSKAG